MKRGLYDELGVAMGATQYEVKKAYRRRTTETHPDAGGNAEEFHRVQHAYEVLSDEERRRVYDETGDDGSRVDRSEAEAFEALVQLVLKAAEALRNNPGSFDILDAARQQVEAVKAGLGDRLRGADRAALRLEQVARRIVCSTGENTLAEAVRVKAASLDAERNRIEEEINKCDLVLELAKRFSYRVDDQQTAGVHFGYGQIAQFRIEMR